MLKEIINKEIERQGYTIIRWKDTLKHGWSIEVTKNNHFTTLFVEEIVAEMINKEMQNK